MLRKKFDALPYLLVLPAAAITIMFSIYPIVYTFRISTHDLVGIQIGEFVGFEHFARILSQPRFYLNLLNSFIYTFGSIAGTMVLGIGLAAILNEQLRGSNFFRTVLLVPWIVTEVVSMILIRWMLEFDLGILNTLLASWGLNRVNFLGSVEFALPTVTLANTWRAFPYPMVMILAAMQTVPESVYESAKLEGVSYVRQTFSIVLPLIKSTILVIAVVTTISFFSRITPILVLTYGGPLYRTEILGVRMYTEAFANLRFSNASVIGVTLLTINLILVLVYIKVIKVEKYY